MSGEAIKPHVDTTVKANSIGESQEEQVKVRLGIIGTGIAARQLHWPALQELGDKFEITVICDRVEERAREFAKLVGGVPYVLDYQEVLKNPDVDAVEILLPVEYNYEVTKDAIAAGKHIIVEKPLAASLEQARQLVELGAKSGKTALLAENFRYRTEYLTAKSILDSGRIGKPTSAVWTALMYMDEQNQFARSEWRIHHKYPGGFVTDAGVHRIGALRMIFGDIESGFAFTQSINPNIGSMDQAQILLRTTGGCDISMLMSFTARGYREERILVLGTLGSMTIGRDFVDVQIGTDVEHHAIAPVAGYREELEDFYNAVASGTQPQSSLFEGYKDLEVAVKAVEASVAGGKFQISPS